MKLLLKDFQTDRTAEFVRALGKASRDVRDDERERWAVSLASPTGSGKTVMVTAAIEAILRGDADRAPDPDATFLWITDQPELNEQTRQRMLETSSELKTSSLVVLDAAFDRETFEPGKVYFLNTQKLGRGTALVSAGDRRTFPLWETVTNTVRDRAGSFYVLIDEAHRGMQEKPGARKEAVTIIQKFIKGSEDDRLEAVPLIAGISATPERFNALIAGANRATRQVEVTAAEVRSSGLLKEAIVLYHPTEGQPSDTTMLRAAVRSWQGYTSAWARYCAAQREPLVVPILTVQVENGTGTKLSNTDLGEAMDAIVGEAGSLPDEAFAHAFQEKAAVEMGGRKVRYLPPSEIQRDPDVRVVFFKTSLNTGWDCPRAEVMMSYRTATDATGIAQLVGRMVRTPLARRVEADEHLNTVALYLPHYDEAGLASVIARLSDPDPEVMPPVEIRKGEDSVALTRRPGSEAAFAALAAVPSYVVPGGRKTSEVARVMKLARRLANDGIEDDAPESATALLLGTLRAEYDRVKDGAAYRALLDGEGRLDVTAVRVRFGEAHAESVRHEQFAISAENVEDVFGAAGRKLGEGLHKAWWKERMAADPKQRVQAKLELSALVADPAVVKRLQAVAQTQTQAWLRRYNEAVKGLPEADRQVYAEIHGQASAPEVVQVTYPDAIDAKREGHAWDRHLYVDASGGFTAKLGSWEAATIEAELARPDVVGWLRVVDRKDWALRVPYESGDRWRPLYPDFLIVRKEDDRHVVDLLDPHNIDLGDSVNKALGLARFAAEHALEFGRIQMIVVVDGDVKRLDLCDETVRNRVLDVKNSGELRLLFDLVPAPADGTTVTRAPDPAPGPSGPHVTNPDPPMADSPKRGDGKRELLEPTEGDKRFARRDGAGQFSEQDDVGRSLAKDVKQRAKTTVKPGHGDEGDQKK